MYLYHCINICFLNDTEPTGIYTLSLHDGSSDLRRRRHVRGEDRPRVRDRGTPLDGRAADGDARSEEHTSELQSQSNLVCRLLLEKKKSYRVSGATPGSRYYVRIASVRRFPGCPS